MTEHSIIHRERNLSQTPGSNSQGYRYLTSLGQGICIRLQEQRRIITYYPLLAQNIPGTQRWPCSRQ